jgi:hypothetical protein
VVDLAKDLKKVRVIAVSLFTLFVVLTSSIAVLIAFTPDLKTATIYEDHEPIYIDGDDVTSDFGDTVTGSGTQGNPFIIENLRIAVSSDVGIQINDTNTFTIIRNCSFEPADRIYRYYSPDGYGKTGIRIVNASNVRVEHSSFDGLENGIAVEGNPAKRSTDVAVSGCIFLACSNGIFLSDADDSLIEYCNMRYMVSCPVLLERCQDSVIAFNSLEGFGAFIPYDRPKYGSGAVAASNCSDVSIHDNLIWGGASYTYYYEAVEIYDSTLISITNNTLANSGRYELRVVRSSGVTVTDNYLEYSKGMYFNSSSECSISRNSFAERCYEARLSASHLSNSLISSNVMNGCLGFRLEYSDNCTLKENLLYVSGYQDLANSVWVSGENISVLRNIVLGGTDGVQVRGKDITVEGNIISGVGVYSKGGLVASSCNRLIITDNKIFDTFPVDTRYGGLCLEYSSNVTLARNNLTYGASFWSARHIDVHDNTFTMPARLYMYESTPVADGIRIVHNNFHYSQVTISGNPWVIWNDTYPAGGNYWSLHEGEDLMSGEDQDQPDPDGIGDEPYAIDYRNNDSYPLMEPIEFIDEAAPITFALTAGEVGYRCWFKSNVSVKLTSSDNYAGVVTTLFRLDGEAWQTYASAIEISGEGNHVLEYYSVDDVGNEEDSHFMTLRIDSHAPVPDDDVKSDYRFEETVTAIIPAGFSDQGSGISRTTVGTSGESAFDTPFHPTEVLVELREGLRTIYISAMDMAGNERSVAVRLEASIRYDRDPLNAEGPYGPLLLLALIADIVIMVPMLVFASRLRTREFKYRPRRPQEPGDRDKAYDVEDGYTKYMKKL